MPATSITGQPDRPGDWFATSAGSALLESESALLCRVLQERPEPPWLWLAPRLQDTTAGGRGLRLACDGDGWRGDFCCSLPLPFASQSLGTIVLQHVPSLRTVPVLLAECARVLVPGGRLYLFALNPLSPYRWRWRGSGIRAAEPLAWRRRLRDAGLEPEAVSRGVGPVWKAAARQAVRNGAGLCAAYMLGAEKRVLPLTPVVRRSRVGLVQGLPAA